MSSVFGVWADSSHCHLFAAMLMRMKSEMSMKEVVEFIEKVGPGLDWSNRYMDLAATACAAVFRSQGISEEEGVLEIDVRFLIKQLGVLRTDLEARGLSSSTAATYEATFKRIVRLISAWHGSLGDRVAESEFWDGIGEYRDTRIQRRSRAVRDFGDSMAARRALAPPVSATRVPKPLSLEMPILGGSARVEVPRPLTHAEAYELMQELTRNGLVEP